jgi:hypothetical protein
LQAKADVAAKLLQNRLAVGHTETTTLLGEFQSVFVGLSKKGLQDLVSLVWQYA